MAVMVTGGAGYIGSHIVLELLDTGRSVVVADNLSTGIRQLVPDEAAFEQIDIRDERRLTEILKLHNVSEVVHCAGSTVVPESIFQPLEYYSNNTGGGLSLLRAMVSAGVKRIIFSSTAAVYAPSDGSRVDELADLAPSTPYGMSKLMTERLIADAAAAHQIHYVILRYFNVAGADPAGRSGQSTANATHLIKVVAEAACARRPYVNIFGTDWPTPDGTGVRDFIHVSDLARIHRLAIEYLRDGRDSVILNCGYGRGYSVSEVIGRMSAIQRKPIPIRLTERRQGDLGEVVAEAEKVKQVLGWSPEFDDLDAILQHALNWEQAQKGLAQPVCD